MIQTSELLTMTQAMISMISVQQMNLSRVRGVSVLPGAWCSGTQDAVGVIVHSQGHH